MKKDLTGQYFGKLLVIKDSGKRGANGGIIWTCRCECGNIVDIAGNNLTRKKHSQKTCGKCHNYEDLTGQTFNLLTVIESTGKIINGRMQWKCKCQCGNITYVHSGNLKSGAVRSCGCLHKQREDLTGQRFGKLTVISYDDIERKWICQCDCGNFTKVKGAKLKDGGTQTCGCSHFSLGEDKIKEILNRYNVTYETQKRFETCRFPDTNALAKFDFYLPQQHIIIEYDGEQHFHAIDFFGGEEGFFKRQAHDIYKNKWCKMNNIQLLRIPFYENNYEEIIIQNIF